MSRFEQPHGKLDVLLEQYEEHHRNVHNRLLHLLGVPLVTLAIAGALRHADRAIEFPVCMLVILGVTVWNGIQGGLGVAGLMLIVYGCAAIFGGLLAMPWLLGIGALGAACLLLGHAVFEKDRPAFVTNLVHLLIGPIHVTMVVFQLQSHVPPTPPGGRE